MRENEGVAKCIVLDTEGWLDGVCGVCVGGGGTGAHTEHTAVHTYIPCVFDGFDGFRHVYGERRRQRHEETRRQRHGETRRDTKRHAWGLVFVSCLVRSYPLVHLYIL